MRTATVGRTMLVLALLPIPLFASGATQARVREALALRDKVRSDADQTRRTVMLGVRQQLSTALAAIAQVPGAQGKLFEARRDLSRALYDAWLADIRLQAVAGTLSESDLAELDGLLLAVDAPDLRVPRRPPRPEAP